MNQGYGNADQSNSEQYEDQGFYDEKGFCNFQDGSFYDPRGVYFDSNGFNEFGGYYDANNQYVEPVKHEPCELELEIKQLEDPDLIDVILSGKIFEPQFQLLAGTKYLTLPDKFESLKHYTKSWDIIFKAEQQALLLQSKKRKAETKDERPPLITFNTEEIPDPEPEQGKRSFMWTGYVDLKDDVEYFKKIKKQNKGRHASNLRIHSDWYDKKLHGLIRTNSLLLLTLYKLDIKDDKKVENDIKKVVSQDFMIKLLQSGKAMFAIANKSRKFPIECEVDKKVLQKFTENTGFKGNVYVYAYEQLNTSLREYHAIFKVAKTEFMDQILDPEPTPKELMVQRNTAGLSTNEGFDVDLNESQKSAVMKINQMRENTIELIQGPPGTGKTHTIANLIAVFFGNGAQRVHVCTPSNSAADEVMLRLSKPGGVPGIPQEKMDKMLLRVGAAEYKASFPELQKYSLDEQIKVLLKVYEEEQLRNQEVQAIRNIQQFRIDNKLPQLEKDIQQSKKEIEQLTMKLEEVQIQQEQVQELILQVQTTEIDDQEDTNSQLQSAQDMNGSKKEKKNKGNENQTFDAIDKIQLLLGCQENSAKQALKDSNGNWIKAVLNRLNWKHGFFAIYSSKDIPCLKEIESEAEAFKQDIDQELLTTKENLLKAKKTHGRTVIEFERPQKELQILIDKKEHFSDLIQKLLEERKNINEEEERKAILKKKQRILVTTLSMAGIERLKSLENMIDYLLIDEAGQCIEPSALIPFKLQPKRVVLVGDQKQLPATTFIRTAGETKFARSLFERMIDNNKPRTMLSIQYRMHPIIRAFPSKQYYDGRLTDGPGIQSRALIPELQTIGQNFQRSVFFDLKSSENEALHSKSNIYEQNFTIALVEFLAFLSLNQSFKPLVGKIGIVSPYKAQVRELREKFKPVMKRHGCRTSDIEINTVDSYQGREKEIMIFNCVRSNNIQADEPWKSLGFLTDERRLNVAITRPRNFLFIIGNEKTLRVSPTWKDLVDSHKQIENGFFQLKRQANEYKNNINLLFEVLSGQEQTASKFEKSAQIQKEQRSLQEENKTEVTNYDEKNLQDREKFTQLIDKYLKDANRKALEFPPSLKRFQNNLIKQIVAQDYPMLKAYVSGQGQNLQVFVKFRKNQDTQAIELKDDLKDSLIAQKDLQTEIFTLQKEQATQQGKQKQTKLVVKNFEKQIAAIGRKILALQKQVHPIYNKINLLDYGVSDLEKKLAKQNLAHETERQLIAEIEKIRNSHIPLKEIEKLQVEITICHNKKAAAENLISELNKTLKSNQEKIDHIQQQDQEILSTSSQSTKKQNTGLEISAENFLNNHQKELDLDEKGLQNLKQLMVQNGAKKLQDILDYAKEDDWTGIFKLNIIQERKMNKILERYRQVREPQTTTEQSTSLQKPSLNIQIQNTPFDNHDKVERLGKGSFGSVDLVRNKKTKELECLKIIDIEGMPEKDVKNILLEAQIHENMGHPNIIKFKKVYRTKCDKMCFILQFAESGDLANLIKRRQESNQKFSQREILGFMQQLCLAVKHMHDRKVLHRDLKPLNIFVTKEGTLKVGDFGISKVMWNTNSHAVTEIGTPFYMAPEIIQNQAYSFKADIWSLGVIFYELIMLKRPFESNTQFNVQQLIVQGDFDRKITGVPPQVVKLVLGCLNQNPTQRPNIHNILKISSITAGIDDHLGETMADKEFEHTILHGQHILPKYVIKQQSNCDTKPTNQTKNPEVDLRDRKTTHAQKRKSSTKKQRYRKKDQGQQKGNE